VLTANRKLHPKIPNYEIQRIPRDPGSTWAYQLGAGVSRTFGPATFALEAIYEPIATHTWAEAAAPIVRAPGDTLPAGFRTVDNEFSFSNAIVRMGVRRSVEPAAFQLGLEMHSISYTLQQQDNVQRTIRTQEENWIEWTHTWGASVRFPEFELRYVGRITKGTGLPGIAFTGVAAGRLEAAADFIPAPRGPLTLQDVTVMTHQLTVSMPIR